MIFYSIQFIILFMGLIIGLHFSKNTKTQHILLLMANIIFYAYWDVRFLVLLFVVIFTSYIFAIQYEKSQQNIWINSSIICCLLILGLFKYCNFFIDSFGMLFHINTPGTLKLILPLGISFYIFQTISYLLDVRYRIICAEKSFVKYAVYISFFPQITSGPIVKARDFLPQLNYIHRITRENIFLGVQQFLLGLTKKIVFADQIGNAVNAVFATPNVYSGISILFAVIGYSLQIYFDFSGYSDMAIGIAKIIGFNFERNFNLPYLASNPSDFWRRWHISLSSWFQKYVYIPLGGSRNGTLLTYRNLFITMLLSGLWHGASWNFVLWGCLHACGAVIHKMWKSTHKVALEEHSFGFSIIFTYLYVTLLWIIFRTDSINHALQIICGLFQFQGVFFISIYTIVGITILLLVNIYSLIKKNGNATDVNVHLETFRGKVLFFVWIFLIFMFMYTGESAFIYAQF